MSHTVGVLVSVAICQFCSFQFVFISCKCETGSLFALRKTFGGCKIIVETGVVVCRDNLLAGVVSRVAFSKAYGGIRTLYRRVVT